MKRTLLFLFLLFQIALGSRAIAQEAMLDMSKVDFNQPGVHFISGNWQFFWNRLLVPADVTEKVPPGELIEVPGGWNRDLNYPSLGFATYRIKIKLPPHTSGLALYFPVINSSARIWINGEFVSETGYVSDDRTLYKAKLAATIVEVPANVIELDVLIQVANYTHFIGGISGTPQLAKISQLVSKLNQAHGVENVFAGSLLAMFIYQLVLFSLYNRGKPYLWLSLICLGVALRAMIVNGGSFLLPNLFPSVSWEVWKKIEFTSVYAIASFFPLYISNLFQKYAPQWPIKFFVGVSALLCLAVLVTPQYIYGQLLEVGHIALLFGFIYAIYSVGKAWKNKSEDARFIFIGVLASFPFILTEILKNSLLYPLNIEFMYMVELGVLVFLSFQIYLLANYYANSFKSLESLNQNLEKIVVERTEQLTTANRVKDRLLSVVSHDIKSPLNSLRGILNIYNMGVMTADEFKDFSKRIENDLSKTGLLVDNILYWTSSQLKGSQVMLESIDLKGILKENIDLFQTIASTKKLSLKSIVVEGHQVNFDRNILNLTIRNLISNAIKFSHERGEIIIQDELRENASLIRITDHGVGMSSDVLNSLQDTQSTKSSAGTSNEKGTGLGLSFCREYLQMAGGELIIESTPGKGSTLTISMPRNA